MNRLIQISLFASLLAACSGSDAPTGNVLGRFEGSFDATTGKVNITMVEEPTGNSTGLSPRATVPYGTAGGQAYVHTGGIGDGLVSAPFSPPSFMGNQLFAQVFFQNGTGSTIMSPKIFWDSTAPGTVTINTNVMGSCTVVVAPCVQQLGSATTVGGFPTPDLMAPSALMIFDASSIGGANFTFSGHLED